MNILLTGATKFLGEHVCKELLSRGLKFDCLVRPSSDTTTLRALGASLVQGDLGEPETLQDVLKPYDTVLNVPNLANLPAAALVRAYEEAGVERAVFVSSTGIFTKLDARTKPLRLAAEKSIRESRLTYTILRPTMIYGTPKDENIIKLLRPMRAAPRRSGGGLGARVAAARPRRGRRLGSCRSARQARNVQPELQYRRRADAKL